MKNKTVTSCDGLKQITLVVKLLLRKPIAN